MHALSAFNTLDSAAQNRALAICVGASVLLHAAVLFLLPGMREGGKPPAQAQVLSAYFSPRTATPYVPPVPEVKAPPPKPEPQRPQPVARPETPRPVLTAPPSSTPSPQVAPAPPVAAPAPPAAPSPPPQAAPAPPTPSAPAQATAAPAGPPSDAVDAGSLEKYRIDVIQAARQFKRYPAAAMEKGWQGKVEIRLVIAPSGITRSSSIKTSSGYVVLDDTARTMVTNGRNKVAIPPALRGKEFVVDVPVIFDLKDG
jgi:protein TonB